MNDVLAIATCIHSNFPYNHSFQPLHKEVFFLRNIYCVIMVGIDKAFDPFDPFEVDDDDAANDVKSSDFHHVGGGNNGVNPWSSMTSTTPTTNTNVEWTSFDDTTTNYNAAAALSHNNNINKKDNSFDITAATDAFASTTIAASTTDAFAASTTATATNVTENDNNDTNNNNNNTSFEFEFNSNDFIFSVEPGNVSTDVLSFNDFDPLFDNNSVNVSDSGFNNNYNSSILSEEEEKILFPSDPMANISSTTIPIVASTPTRTPTERKDTITTSPSDEKKLQTSSSVAPPPVQRTATIPITIREQFSTIYDDGNTTTPNYLVGTIYIQQPKEAELLLKEQQQSLSSYNVIVQDSQKNLEQIDHVIEISKIKKDNKDQKILLVNLPSPATSSQQRQNSSLPTEIPIATYKCHAQLRPIPMVSLWSNIPMQGLLIFF